MKLIAKPFKLPFSSDIIFSPFNKRILRKLDLFKKAVNAYSSPFFMCRLSVLAVAF
jgi:hypothetical protein